MRGLSRSALFVSLALSAAGCQQEGTIAVHSIKFAGVRGVDQSRLRQALATRENTRVPLAGWELPWGRKRFFDRMRFDADLQRIQSFYADRGYPDARVAGVEVELNRAQTAVDVTLTIVEGDPVRVASVAFAGFEVVPPNHLNDLKDEVPLRMGRPRDRESVATAREMALNELRDHGYPYARVTIEEDGGPTGKEAAIAFTAIPGPIANFGEIEIAGNLTVGDHVIERELIYEPGDLYRRSVVQNAQRRLYGLELFQFVNIESLEPERQGPDVKTRVTVAEGKHQRVNFGVGYGSEEKGRVDAQYHHLNFLGGARSAGVNGRWSSLDRGLRADFTQPYFVWPHFSLGSEAQRWYTVTPAYDSRVIGAKVTLMHREDVRTSWALSMTAERARSAISESTFADPSLRNDLIALGLDPTTLRQEGTLAALGFDFQRSTADNALSATSGYQIAVHGEHAGAWLPGTFNYDAVSVDVRQYAPFGGALVLASRLQIASTRAGKGVAANVPFTKKHFLGGATSLRGWGRYEVSPLGESGFPIGGNSLLALSEELRADLGGSFGAVLFFDAGNVWVRSGDSDLADLRYDVGTGIRYQTPVGPIRFDVGYQINPLDGLLVDGKPQKRRWRLHFSIGQAF